MSLQRLSDALVERRISVALSHENIVLRGPQFSKISDELISDVRAYKSEIREIFRHQSALGYGADPLFSSLNSISAGCEALTPEMLPLIDLTQEDIEQIIAATPGGLANIQDLYALAPLQDGILFHHLLSAQGD